MTADDAGGTDSGSDSPAGCSDDGLDDSPDDGPGDRSDDGLGDSPDDGSDDGFGDSPDDPGDGSDDGPDGTGVASGASQLPTVRVVVDFQPDRHLLFNVNDEQARAMLERVHEERATAPDAQVHRLAFDFSAGQIEQTSEAFRRMDRTDAADAALVDLTVTEDGVPLPTLTVMLSMNEATASELAAGFADAVRRNDTGEWFVEVPALSMELLERALSAALDGAERPTDEAMRELRADR